MIYASGTKNAQKLVIAVQLLARDFAFLLENKRRLGTPGRRLEMSMKVRIEKSEIRQVVDRYAKLVVASELSGIDLSEESEYVKDILPEHPEYVEGFLSGKDRDGMNPRVHIFVESVIQTQIESNDPTEVREAHLALMAGPSLDAH